MTNANRMAYFRERYASPLATRWPETDDVRWIFARLELADAAVAAAERRRIKGAEMDMCTTKATVWAFILAEDDEMDAIAAYRKELEAPSETLATS